MINRHELRIGNLVHIYSEPNPIKIPQTGITHSVSGIGFSEVELIIGSPFDPSNQFPPFKTRYSDITGVPLTKVWLEKFGLKEGQWCWILNETVGITELYHLDSNKWMLVTYKGEEIFLGVEFLYVHQLQNIYFALTGEELKV